jgi:hypothetical protein
VILIFSEKFLRILKLQGVYDCFLLVSVVVTPEVLKNATWSHLILMEDGILYEELFV